MKVACFSPLTPVKSGIADYFEDLIPYLVPKGIEFDFIYEKLPPENEYIVKNCEFHKQTDFPELARKGAYDLVIYHIGNHTVHNYMYDYYFDFPGLTVLHDFVLHHARLAHFVLNRNLSGYMKEMDMIGAYDIAKIVSSGMGGEFLYYNFAMNRRIIEQSLSLIIHNTYLKRKIENEYPGKLVFLIPHNTKSRIISQQRISALKKELGIPENGLVIAAFGFMNESKQISLTSMALKYLMPKHPNLYYLICGEDKEGVARKDYFDYPGIRDKVKVSGYIEGLEKFIEYIALSDIVINLRFPSAGETSGTMIRSMAQGKPVITYDNPTLIDIPEDAIARIKLTDDSRQLVHILERLIDEPGLRSEIGSNARRYAESDLSMETNAEKYISALKATISASTGRK